MVVLLSYNFKWIKKRKYCSAVRTLSIHFNWLILELIMYDYKIRFNSLRFKIKFSRKKVKILCVNSQFLLFFLFFFFFCKRKLCFNAAYSHNCSDSTDRLTIWAENILSVMAPNKVAYTLLYFVFNFNPLYILHLVEYCLY